MTLKELKEIIMNFPDDSIVMYCHNKYGKIDIDAIDYEEEHLMSGEIIKMVSFDSNGKEN